MAMSDDEKRRRRHLRYLANKDKVAEQNRAWHQANPEKVKAIHRAYREANKDRIREQSREYREANRERIRETERRYREANKEARAEARRAYHEANPTLQTEWALRRRYGISLADFNALLEGQGGRCAICRTSTPPVRGWTVDHCHDSGRVRGVLCFNCNVAIGHLKDDPAVAEAAAQYLSDDQAQDVAG